MGVRCRSFLVLAAGVLATTSASVEAELVFYRTNTPGGVQASMSEYASLAALGSNTPTGGAIDINPDISYLFYDGTSYYKTLNGGAGTNQIVRYSTLANLTTNTSGTTFNLSQAWSGDDDFYADGVGNYYRNSSPPGGTNGTTKYPSFNDLVNNTNGTIISFTSTFGFADRFFASEGTF